MNKNVSNSKESLNVEFTVNGRNIQVNVACQERLLDTLRYKLSLTGTKEGCSEGECGACTVHVDGLPVMSCLVLTCQMRGRNVRTIESIDEQRVHALLLSGATQCGACTPGVVMMASWICEHPEMLATHSLRELMAGNLCRCTGYDGIIDGISASLPKEQSG
jgi:aerobic carbon-monoxide dehydrogenase small subunit